MKQRTTIITFKTFEMLNPNNVIGGSDGPIIDKKKLREALERVRR